MWEDLELARKLNLVFLTSTCSLALFRNATAIFEINTSSDFLAVNFAFRFLFGHKLLRDYFLPRFIAESRSYGIVSVQ